MTNPPSTRSTLSPWIPSPVSSRTILNTDRSVAPSSPASIFHRPALPVKTGVWHNSLSSRNTFTTALPLAWRHHQCPRGRRTACDREFTPKTASPGACIPTPRAKVFRPPSTACRGSSHCARSSTPCACQPVLNETGSKVSRYTSGLGGTGGLVGNSAKAVCPTSLPRAHTTCLENGPRPAGQRHRGRCTPSNQALARCRRAYRRRGRRSQELQGSLAKQSPVRAITTLGWHGNA